jgi:hypothetical protein
MKIERSSTLKAQLAEASALRATLIEQLTQDLDAGPAKKKSKKKEPKNPFLHNIELSAEGFDLF